MPTNLDPDQKADLIREATRRDRTDSLESSFPDLPFTSKYYTEDGELLARVTPFGFRYNWQVLRKMLLVVEPMPKPTGLSFYKEPPAEGVANPDGWNALARAVASFEDGE